MRPYYKAYIEEPAPTLPIKCGCGWEGMFKDVADIGDCCLTPGDPSPCGRCPDCEDLVYVPNPNPKPFWVVVYEHRYGTDVWIRDRETTVKQEAADLADWEGDERDDEWLEIRGPFFIGENP